VGADGQGVAHSGHSGAWDAMGLPLCAVPSGEAATAVVEVRKEDLDAVRRRLPFLQDVRAL
jgi:predicted amidohydrolase